MPGTRKFLDTNVFGYTFDLRDRRKRDIATGLIVQLIQDGTATVSYQVVHEFVNLAMKSKIPGLDVALAQRYVNEAFQKMVIIPSSFGVIERALALQPQTQLPWYDCLILAAALEGGCDVLYSEDLQHGQNINGLTVLNPFR